MTELKYIPIDGRSESTQKKPFEKGWNLESHQYDLDTALLNSPSNSASIVVPSGYVVIDVDEMNSAEKLLKIIEDKGIKSSVLKTTRGMHFWFRVNPAYKPFKTDSHRINLLTLEFDPRCSNSQLLFVSKGEYREWLMEYDLDELDEMPFFLQAYDFDDAGKENSLIELLNNEEGNRTIPLHKYFGRLQCGRIESPENHIRSHFSLEDEEIFEIINLINDYIFTDSLTEEELNNEVLHHGNLSSRDECIDIILECTGSREKAPEKHGYLREFDARSNYIDKELAADEIAQETGVFYNSDENKFYYYTNNYYQQIKVENLGIVYSKINKKLTIRQKKEITDALKSNHSFGNEFVNTDSDVINIVNGRFNVKDFTLSNHDKKYIETTRFNVEYKPLDQIPAAVKNRVDEIENSIFNNDPELRRYFHAICGTCYCRDTYSKAFIFFGPGGTGKSKTVDLLKARIGAENCSSVSFRSMDSNRFSKTAMVGKYANIVDDEDLTDFSEEYNRNAKSLITGGGVDFEKKGQDSFNADSFASLIHCTNIRFSASGAIRRRIKVIPFKQVFDGAKNEMSNKEWKELAENPDVLSYLFWLDMDGLKWLHENDDMFNNIHVKAVEEETDEFWNAMDPYESWLLDNDIDESTVLEKVQNKTPQEVEAEYQSFCKKHAYDTMAKFKMRFESDFKEQIKVGRPRLEDGTRPRAYVAR